MRRTPCLPSGGRRPPGRGSRPSGMTDRSRHARQRPLALLGRAGPFPRAVQTPSAARSGDRPRCAHGDSGGRTCGRTSCGAGDPAAGPGASGASKASGSPEFTLKPSASAFGGKEDNKPISGKGGNQQISEYEERAPRGGPEGRGQEGRSLRRPREVTRPGWWRPVRSPMPTPTSPGVSEYLSNRRGIPE